MSGTHVTSTKFVVTVSKFCCLTLLWWYKLILNLWNVLFFCFQWYIWKIVFESSHLAPLTFHYNVLERKTDTCRIKYLMSLFPRICAPKKSIKIGWYSVENPVVPKAKYWRFQSSVHFRLLLTQPIYFKNLALFSNWRHFIDIGHIIKRNVNPTGVRIRKKYAINARPFLSYRRTISIFTWTTRGRNG